MRWLLLRVFRLLSGLLFSVLFGYSEFGIAIQPICLPANEQLEISEMADVDLATGYIQLPLKSTWEFHKSGTFDWIPAEVPAPWEEFIGTSFDGTGTYRTTIDSVTWQEINQVKATVEQTAGPHELFLVFDGVATDAQVKINGQVAGGHLGPWTPWAVQVQANDLTSESLEIQVNVDEKVGHHTQGFLPVFLPHFGGIWQPVRFELRPVARILVDQCLVLGHYSDDGNHWIDLDLPLSPGVMIDHLVQVTVQPPTRAKRHWLDEANQVCVDWEVAQDFQTVALKIRITAEQLAERRIRTRLQVPQALAWTPQAAWLYPVQLTLTTNEALARPLHQPLHQATLRTGIRRYETRGHQLLLNGQPLILQGILNWGYVPPAIAPSLQPAEMFQELLAAQRLGLNLMKFCLWIPPKRYLELADEMGMLTWIEYPTWHAQLIDSNLAELSREYTEFTNYDRNHPSVVLRSLTCETGPSAHLSVIQHLYDLVHRQVPGAIVEDDSSWISWNRVSDIWDDHPYGNNHTWVETLGRLRAYIAQRDAKPLVLGEAIAADTWPDLDKMVNEGESYLQQYPLESRPVWYFGFLEAAQKFTHELQARGYSATAERIKSDSIDYAFLMRKYQVETYRREVPWGGYVLSVIRDFPFAAMGLLDTWGQNKFPMWGSQQKFQISDSMLVLETPADRRSWFSQDVAKLDLLLATPHELPSSDEPSLTAAVVWQLVGASETGEEIVLQKGNVNWELQRPATLTATSADHPRIRLEIQWPAVEQPTHFTLRVVLEPGQTAISAANEWSVWIFPQPASPWTQRPVVADSTLSEQHRRWFNELSDRQLIGWRDSQSTPAKSAIIVASRFHIELLDQLEAGATVLMLPDGGPRSFPTQAHWFLRGGPLVFSHPILGKTEPEFSRHANVITHLQHFDLAGDTQPQFTFWKESSPIVALWDNHDIRDVRMHGLLWEAQVGQGRLLMSMLNHDLARSAAGPYFLARCLEHLSSDYQPQAWSAELRARLRTDLVGQDLNLTSAQWRLKPDPNSVGLAEDWAAAEHTTRDWQPIRIDSHWDGQGFPALDGWAWYATEVMVPEDWEGQPLYLCFAGVDDHYQAFVNGKKVGEAGVIETKETAFEMRTSHQLPEDIHAGQRISIRVAVYDWYGAGGIFRPVYLRTTPWTDSPPLLKR